MLQSINIKSITFIKHLYSFLTNREELCTRNMYCRKVFFPHCSLKVKKGYNAELTYTSEQHQQTKKEHCT